MGFRAGLIVMLAIGCSNDALDCEQLAAYRAEARLQTELAREISLASHGLHPFSLERVDLPVAYSDAPGPQGGQQVPYPTVKTGEVFTLIHRGIERRAIAGSIYNKAYGPPPPQPVIARDRDSRLLHVLAAGGREVTTRFVVDECAVSCAYPRREVFEMGRVAWLLPIGATLETVELPLDTWTIEAEYLRERDCPTH